MTATKKKFQVKINQELCKSCGICYWVCPTKAIVEGKLSAPKFENPDACIGCKQCERLCPDFAIDVLEREGEEKNG